MWGSYESGINQMAKFHRWGEHWLSHMTSWLEELLQLDGSVTIHKLNTYKLIIEIFKTMSGLNPDFMEDIFSIHDSPYDLRTSHFEGDRPNTIRYGLDNLTNRGSKIWNSISEETKNCNNVQSLKNNIKNNYRETNLCNCRLCTDFLQNIGYI